MDADLREASERFAPMRKNDWQEVQVCLRCGCLFLPMVIQDAGDPDEWEPTECPHCDVDVPGASE